MSDSKKDFLIRKEKLDKLVSDAGYESFREFSQDVGITAANLYSNLHGTWNMSMKRMFKVANTLNVPILQVIEIFYPEELKENQMML